MSPKRKRGQVQGARQRLAAERAEMGLGAASSSSGGHGMRSNSQLVGLLIMLWAWGFISPQLVQRISSAVDTDIKYLNARNKSMAEAEVRFEEFEDIVILAGIGDYGRYSNNCNRDLMRVLPAMNIYVPSPTMIPLKQMNVATHTWRSCKQVILWPHVLFAMIYEHYKDTWAKRVCPGVEAVRNYWHCVRNSPQLDNDHIKARGDFTSHCVPIMVHGDGVPVTGIGKSWGKMCDVWSWSSALGTGSTLDITFYIYSVFQRLLCKSFGHDTYRHFSKKLAWSLLALWHGIWPTHDEYGMPYQEASQCVVI